MKWKRSTSALLAAAAGTWALTPIRATAQQPPSADAPPAAAFSATTQSSAAYDAVAALAGKVTGMEQSQRDEAAQRLLSRHTTEARQALRDALVAPDEGGQLAVARALAMDPAPDASFIDPLFPLLDNPKTAAAAGRALAGFKTDPEVLTRLIDRAKDRHNATPETREAAIRAIGSIPEKGSADTLMDLLESPDEPPSIHTAAAAALINLTGLDQNGADPVRWSKWWATARRASATQFRTDISAQQAARFDRLGAQYEGLVGAVTPLLSQEYYKTKSLAEREDLMLKFLRSPEPEIRKIGIGLLGGDVEEGNQLSQEELASLRDMIADSDPSVRRAVAKTIGSVNDKDALAALLAQLAVEPDPTVRAAIAEALGPIQDLRAVPTLIKLLSDDSLETAKAAADALRDLAQDKLSGDPTRARQAAEALKNTVIAKSSTQGSDDLRAACIKALAPLQNASVVQELIDHKLLDPGKEESSGVRIAMLIAVGALNDPHLADLIADRLDNDPSPDVQVQAIKALETNPRAADYVLNVGRLLAPDPSKGQQVSDEAWSFMQAIFPKLNEPQLEYWVQQLKNDAGRQLIVLEVLAGKQVAANEADDLAVTRTQIGDDYKALKQWGDAAASYGAALKTYDGLPNIGNQQAMVQSLINEYMQALLNDGKEKYSEAIALAADRIKRDPSEQSNLGPIIADKVEELGDPGPHQDLAAARELIDQASKMVPPLDGKYLGRVKAVADAIQKKTSSIDNASPVPQSATADGK